MFIDAVLLLIFLQPSFSLVREFFVFVFDYLLDSIEFLDI
jgi:hypothetical protein